MSGLTGILDDIAGVAAGYIGGGVTVAVKTNYTPAIRVYSAGSASGSSGVPALSSAPQGFSLGHLASELAGLQVGVTVSDESGRVLASYGPDNGAPPTDWARVAALVALLGLLALGAAWLIRRV